MQLEAAASLVMRGGRSRKYMVISNGVVQFSQKGLFCARDRMIWLFVLMLCVVRKNELPSSGGQIPFFSGRIAVLGGRNCWLQVFRIMWCPGFFWRTKMGDGEQELQAGTLKRDTTAYFNLGCVCR